MTTALYLLMIASIGYIHRCVSSGNVFDDNSYLEGCDYIYTESNNLIGPNACVASYADKTGNYAYKYECNSTNDEYFIKREYYGSNAYKCSNKALKNSIKYSRSHGYNFNCSNDRQDCSCLWLTEYSCQSANYNETSFIVGTCLPPNASFVSLEKEREDISSGSMGSIQMICSTQNLGKITEIDYENVDNYCGNGEKAKNTTIKAGCNSQTGHNYMLVSCNMPKKFIRLP